MGWVGSSPDVSSHVYVSAAPSLLGPGAINTINTCDLNSQDTIEDSMVPMVHVVPVVRVKENRQDRSGTGEIYQKFPLFCGGFFVPFQTRAEQKSVLVALYSLLGAVSTALGLYGEIVGSGINPYTATATVLTQLGQMMFLFLTRYFFGVNVVHITYTSHHGIPTSSMSRITRTILIKCYMQMIISFGTVVDDLSELAELW